MTVDEIEKYFTPFAICQMRENGISVSVLGQRLATNKPLDEAFEFKTRGRKSIYPKWAYDKAKVLGISRQTLYHRTKRQGMTIEQAVEKGV